MIRVDDATLSEIVDAWGVTKQVDMVLEEMGELQVAICKYRRKGADWVYSKTGQTAREMVIEETADVLLMAEQLAFIIGRDEVETAIQEKLDRTLKLLRMPDTSKRTPLLAGNQDDLP